jgi:Putative adhesin
MALSVRSVKGLALPAALAGLLAAPGCVDIIGADLNKYVERDEKHFAVSGKPDVALATFDGSIEIRPWDKPDVQVVIEKRGRDHDDVAAIEVKAEQRGNRIEISIIEPKREHSGFNLHFHNRSASLIVSVPASSDVTAKSGDGSIDIEGVTGRAQLRSGDGSIRGRMLSGDVDVNTGDGSIKLDGKLTAVRVHTGDGSVTIRADSGSSAGADWDIVTGDGSVTIEVPDGFGAELDAHTGDGGIRMRDLTLSNVTGNIGKNTLRGRLGDGGRAVRVRTGDGSITLRKS